MQVLINYLSINDNTHLYSEESEAIRGSLGTS